MQLDMSGHHVEITQGIRDAVNYKISKIATRHPELARVEVFLKVEPRSQVVELQTQYLGLTVSVKASNDDLYAAISESAKKFDAALSKRRGASRSYKNDRLASAVVE